MSHLVFGASFDLSANAAAPLADWAREIEGKPFDDRAAGPDAFDCTGVVEWTQALLDRPVRSYAEHYSSADCAAPGARDTIIRFEMAAWLPAAGDVGDVLILGTGRRAHHVAVLCGGGKAIHARHQDGVIIAPIEGRKRVKRFASHWIYAVLRPA